MILLRLLLALALGLGAGPAWAQARLALVVGNAGYAEAVGPLLNPRRDAELVAQALSAQGFQVTIVTDAGRVALLSAVDAHAARLAQAGPGAISFFYYSGHGVANPADGRNYLVPTDASTATDNRLWYESVPLRDVVAKFAAAASGVTSVVVFDACRDALKLPGGAKGLGGAGKGLAREPEQPSTLLAFATAPEATAADQDGGALTGPYATELAKHLRAPKGDLRAMFDDVKYGVLERTGRRQQPWVEDGLSNRVFLAGEPAAAVAAVPQPQPVNPGSGPARWGLGNRDLSVLSGAELLTKAQFAGRAEAIRAAAGAGDPHAALLAGMAAQLGVGGAADPAAAVAGFRRASEGGVARGDLNLGLLLLQGSGAARDSARGEALVRAAAEAGTALAMSHLGNSYRTGAGVPVDPAKSADWTRRAAEAGEPYAMNTMGANLRDGYGVAKDPKAALGWFRRAADAGLPAAMASLGAMHINGTGIPADQAEGMRWYRRAADAGYAPAKAYLAQAGGAGQGELAANIYFDWDSVTLNPMALTTLDSVLPRLRGASAIRLVGHTDRGRTAAYSQGLSERTAQAVRRRLIDAGIAADIITVEARGETDPQVPTAAGVREPLNRRVAIYAVR